MSRLSEPLLAPVLQWGAYHIGVGEDPTTASFLTDFTGLCVTPHSLYDDPVREHGSHLLVANRPHTACPCDLAIMKTRLSWQSVGNVVYFDGLSWHHVQRVSYRASKCAGSRHELPRGRRGSTAREHEALPAVLVIINTTCPREGTPSYSPGNLDVDPKTNRRKDHTAFESPFPLTAFHSSSKSILAVSPAVTTWPILYGQYPAR